MLRSLGNSLHKARNPLLRVKHHFPRYLIITCCTGVVGFGVALAMLYLGFGPFVTLVVSACASGLLNYTAMELWAFPHREGKGRLSFTRLWKNTVVGVVGFGARYLVLTLALNHLLLPFPFDKAAPLALAYLASFLIGYVTRSRIIFRRCPDEQ